MNNFIKIILTSVMLFLIISCGNNKVNDILNGSFIEPPEQMKTPTLLRPKNNELLTSDCVFIWTKVENALRYRIEICANDQFNELVFSKVVDTEQFQINVTELTSTSKKLFWRVVPIFTYMNGSPSEIFRINIVLNGIIYVSNSVSSSSSNGNGFGYSDDPFKNIDDAVEIANKIDGVQKIYIAEGTYTTEAVISQDVEIYGGFSKTDWTVRDRNNYKTIIVPRTYAPFTLLSPITHSTIIDGNYFDNYSVGYCTYIYISPSASPVISNNVFKNTFQEAAQTSIYSLDYSYPIIQNCYLEMGSDNNSLPNFLTINSNVEIINSTFDGITQLNNIDANIYNSTFNGITQLNNINASIYNSTFNGQTRIQGTNSIIHDNNFMYSSDINGYHSEVFNNYIYNNSDIRGYTGFCTSNYLEGSTSIYYTTGKVDRNSFYGTLYLNCGSNKMDVLNNYFSNKLTQTFTNNIEIDILTQTNSTAGSLLIEGNYFEIPNLTSSTTSAICINTMYNNSSSSIFSMYIVNNTINYKNSLSYTNYGIYYYNVHPVLTFLLNNIFVTTGTSNLNIGMYVFYTGYPLMQYNSFIGTSLVNQAFNTGMTSYSASGLNTFTGSTTNTFDYDYNNVFLNIDDTSAPYKLKSTATCAIDKGYNVNIDGTNLSDIVTTDITTTHSRLSGAAIDIGAYEYQ